MIAFTTDPPSDAELMAAQNITVPQGLDAVAYPAWDAEDEAYYAFLVSGEHEH